MENTFTINGKQCRVTLDSTGLSWSVQDSSHGKFRVPAAEVISCWSCPKGSLKCCPRQEENLTNYPENEGLTSEDNESKLSTISTTSNSLLPGSNSGFHYGTTERNNTSQCESNAGLSTDKQHSTVAPSSIPNAHGEKSNDDSSCRLKERFTGLPFKDCVHSKKLNKTPALAVEICERVLPSSLLRGCCSGDGEVMVTTWKSRVLVLQHEATDTVSSWLKALWEVVTGNPLRPRHLLVIVNPVSGSKTSERLYNLRVAPFLHRAGIRVTLRKTTHSGHAGELAAEATMESDVDGVVTVSGDGTFAEAITGLMRATASQLGVSIDDRNTAFPKISVNLGLIPGGSSNAYVTACHGTGDTTTSVLQIIMGTCRNVHLGGLYVQDQLVHVSQMNVHVGYVAGVIEMSSSLRHLGPNRNIIAGAKEFFQKRSYECEVRYLAEENVRDLLHLDEPECQAACLACHASSTQVNTRHSQGKWVQLKGEYDIVSFNASRAECSYSIYGVSPLCHVNNGYCDGVLVSKLSKPRFLLHMFRISSTKNHITKAPVVAFRTSELHCRILTQPSPLSCDGELRYYPEFVFKMHRQCLSVYSRGREPLSALDLSTLTNYFK
ncbi:Diacylglycerol kinase catalytic domain [Trinorchestia longiramus]|nr:Diacylglycerol kinase catalytic domain [Trinorchestia longiramus]